MIDTKNNAFYKLILLILAGLSILMFVLAFMSKPAHADSYDRRCGTDTGHYVQARIFLQYLDFDGTDLGYSTNFDFNVTASIPNTARGDDVYTHYGVSLKNGDGSSRGKSAKNADLITKAIRNNNGGNSGVTGGGIGNGRMGASVNIAARVNSGSDYQRVYWCDVTTFDRNGLQGYNQKPSYTFNDGSNRNYILDCLGFTGSTDMSSSASFAFKLIDGYDKTGHYNNIFDYASKGPSDRRDVNQDNLMVVFKQQRRAEWNVSASSKVSYNGGSEEQSKTISVLKNQPVDVTFHHSITNSKTSITKTSLGVNGDIYKNNNTIADCPIPGRISIRDDVTQDCGNYLYTSMDLASGTTPESGRNAWAAHKIDTSNPGQQKYCEHVHYSPSNQDNNASGDSTEACVTVNVMNPTPIIASSNYEKGSSTATAKHFIIVDGCLDNMAINWQISAVSGSKTFYNKSIASVISPPSCTAYAPDENFDTVMLNSQDPGYSIQLTTSYPGVSPATSSIVVYEVPYARFYGQDIYATGCDSAAPNNGKAFFNTKNPASGDGGASQYAAIAKSTVNMATAAFRSSAPMPQNGLAVANYSGLVDCSDTVYNSIIGSIKDASSIQDNDQTISGINIIPEGGQTIATKDGKNIYISGNITGGGLNKIVTLVAGGNIYISPSVTRIDAVLISKGMVYTCANASGNGEAARSTWQTSCRETLTINGAVSAKDIRFARSVGTRLMASTGEDSGSAGKDNIDTRTGSNSTAAEVINYPAYLNFSSLNLIDNSLNSANAIFNVPPLL